MILKSEQEILGNLIPNAYISKITLETTNEFVSTRTNQTNIPRTRTVPINDEKIKVTLNIVLKAKLDNSLTIWFEQQDYLKYLRVKLIQNSDEEKTNKIFNFSSDISLNQRKKNFSDYKLDSNGNKIIDIPLVFSFILKNNPNNLSYELSTFLDINSLKNELNLDLTEELENLNLSKIIQEKIFENGKLIDKSYLFLDQNKIPWTGAIIKQNDKFLTATEPPEILTRIQINNNKIQDFRNFKKIENIKLDYSLLKNLRSKQQINLKKKEQDFIFDHNSYFTEMMLSYDLDDNIRGIFGIDIRRLLQEQSNFGEFYKNGRTFQKALDNTKIKNLKILRRRIIGSSETGSEPSRNFNRNNKFIDKSLINSRDKNLSFVKVQNNISSLEEIKNIFVENKYSVGMRYFTFLDKDVKNKTDGYYEYYVQLELEDGGVYIIKDFLKNINDSIKLLENYYIDATKQGNNKFRLVSNNPHIDHPDELRINEKESIPGAYDYFLGKFTDYFVNLQLTKWNNSEESPWKKPVNTYIELLSSLSSVTEQELNGFEHFLLLSINPRLGNPDSILKLTLLLKDVSNQFKRLLNINNHNSINEVNSTRVFSKNTLKTIKINKFFKQIIDSNLLDGTGIDYLDSKFEQESFGLKIIDTDSFKQRTRNELETIFNINERNYNININIENGSDLYTENDNILNSSYSFLGPSKVYMFKEEIIKRIGNSPTPKIERDKLSLFDLKVKNYNSNIKNKDNDINSISKKLISKFGLSTIKNNNINKNLPFENKNVNKNLQEEKIQEFLEKNEEDCKTNNFETETNTTPLILSLLNRVKFNSNNEFNKSKNSLYKNNKLENNTIFSRYDLSKRGNYIENLLQEPKKIKSELFFRGEKHNTTLSDALQKLPNQTKALFLQHQKPELVKKNWINENISDVSINLEVNNEFQLLQNLIQQIDIFSGYELDSKTNEPIITKPIWRPLTLEKFQRIRGKLLLCRFKQYENSLVGVIPDESLQLKTFDEYFLLKTLPLAQIREDIDLIPINILPKINFNNLKINDIILSNRNNNNNNINNSNTVNTNNTSLNINPPQLTNNFGAFEPISQEEKKCNNFSEELINITVPTEFTTTNSETFDSGRTNEFEGELQMNNSGPTLAGF